MKSILHPISLSFLSISLLFAACSSKELDRETALRLLREQKSSSAVIEKEIYTADPEEARRILDSGLEKEGLLNIQKVQSADDIGKPFISFTEKAKPYLLPVTIEDKKSSVQRVKIAEEEIGEVTGVHMLDGDKRAEVEYTTNFKNITPFASLTEYELDGKETRKAKFALYDDGWRVEE